MRPVVEHAEELALEVLERAGMPAWPAFDPHYAARELGVAVERVPGGPDGRFIHHDTLGSFIHYDPEPPRVRQNFTIAHELAHWAIQVGLTESCHRAAALEAAGSEEAVCNLVAGALVLPLGWLWTAHRSLWRPTRETLVELRDVAHGASCSLEAALVRLRDRCGWTSTLLHWRRHRPAGRPARWVLLTQAGIYSGSTMSLMPRPSVQRELDWAPHHSIEPWTLSMTYNGAVLTADADVWVRDEDAVALIRPPLACDLDSAVVEALSMSVWYKRDLLAFVRRVLGRGTWDQSWPDARANKRAMAEQIVSSLSPHRGALRALAEALSDQVSFEALEVLPDAAYRIARARRAVVQLQHAIVCSSDSAATMS